MAVGLIHRRGRGDPQRMQSRPGMGIQTLSRQSPHRRWLPNRFPSHRRFGGGFPSISPVTAVLAVASQLFPRSPPFRRWLPKYFPGHCRFGSRLPSVSPVIAVLAVASQVFPRSSPFWRLLPNRFPGHRRFGGRLPSSSSVTAVLAVASETSPRLPPRRKAKSWPVKTCPSCSSSASTSRRNS